jgi:LDH2 family malate/lactate/ureidoglycolate dehydrogenase
MKRYASEDLQELVGSIAQAVGVPEEGAGILAKSLIDADIHGASTHGVSRLHIYVRRIQKGLIDPRAELIVEKKKPSILLADAGNGLGQVQSTKVFQSLLPMARTSGLAAASIKNSQHFGSLSYYCNQAAEENMILLATTNAEPSMAPEGGYEPYFGTNPLAVSFPTGKGYPLKIDLSTSLVARGNIIEARKKGKDIPLGWALDSQGNPTTDAEKALMGTVLTMAGHKGYALAVMVEVLSGVLSGSAFGRSIGSMYKDMHRKQDVGHFFCLLDLAAFMDISFFIERIDRMIDEIKHSEKRPGIEEILVPGERSFRKAQENLKNGIPVGEETMKEMEALCREFSIPFFLRPMENGESF